MRKFLHTSVDLACDAGVIAAALTRHAAANTKFATRTAAATTTAATRTRAASARDRWREAGVVPSWETLAEDGQLLADVPA